MLFFWIKYLEFHTINYVFLKRTRGKFLWTCGSISDLLENNYDNFKNMIITLKYFPNYIYKGPFFWNPNLEGFYGHVEIFLCLILKRIQTLLSKKNDNLEIFSKLLFQKLRVGLSYMYPLRGVFLGASYKYTLKEGALYNLMK